MDHLFTTNIKSILSSEFQDRSEQIFEKSLLIQYINFKTRSANKDSKARSSFANLYAIYVIIEDYVHQGFDTNHQYSNYEGALFNKLLARQRDLPFGNKLQNHALNNRVNSEFQKFFPHSEFIPILRNLETNRYWINENLLQININKHNVNIAKTILHIIDEYILQKQKSFNDFIQTCKEIQEIGKLTPTRIKDFIVNLLSPQIDARLFEIVSYSILKYFYFNQQIFWGFEINKLTKENLKLFKTGRTNANDGGIDFVMIPLGRFFQVTETLDFKKYFLDIDKVQKFPISFIIKSSESIEIIRERIKENANKTYSIRSIVDKYINCIEEIITIPILLERFTIAVDNGYTQHILDEILLQSKVEFNLLEEEIL
ncbi:MAG: restriction endonuclease [Candidatus Kapabacteria bacterium]|nr:restriction endonuclease [Candidatus Kapabacteria bacterium]